MVAVQRALGLALVVGTTLAFACSSGLPNEKSRPGSGGSAGDAGNGVAGEEEAGANSSGGAGLGGNSANEAGADSAAGDGGDGGADSNGSQGGDSAQGGTSNGGGGAQGGGVTGGGANGDLFAIGAPSSDCQAAPPLEGSVPLVPGLQNAPSSGHKCDDTFEPSNTDGEACQLTLGAPVGTQLSKPNDPVDKFIFHAEATVSYTLIVSAIKCTGTSSLDALRFTVTSVGQTATRLTALAYFGQQDAFTIPPANTTADQVITFTADQSCEYDFKLVQSTAQGLMHGADHEPNDTPTTAQPIKLNRAVSSSVSNPKDRRDYFSVPVQANLTYSIRVSTKGCSGTSSLDSMTVQGQSLGAGDPVTNLNITAYLNGVYGAEFTTKASGEELLMFSGAQSCAYDFYVIPSTICGLGHDKNSFEPNDTPSIAAPIVLGQTIRAEVQAEDATDYYSFAVEPNSQYTLSLSTSSCHGVSSLDSLSAELWSGRTKDVKKESKAFYFGHGREPLVFTSGSSSQQLLQISSGQSCGYEFSITKG